MNYPKIPKGSLAPLLAQIIHFSRDDYSFGEVDDDCPEDVVRNASYICACFLAQHTRLGDEGVDTECPYVSLRAGISMPFDERLRLAEKLVKSFGGQR